MRCWVSLIACFAALLLSAAWAQEIDVVRRADAGVFRLVNFSEFSSGTGFLVDEGGYLVTNLHVVSGAENLFVVQAGSHGNEIVKAEVIAFDQELDLAVIFAPGLNGRPLILNPVLPAKGQKVFALGFPGLADLRKPSTAKEFVAIMKSDANYATSSHTNGDISRVVVESWRPGSRKLNIIQHTAAVRHGNSGGPLLNLCGEVVGINTQIRFDEFSTTVHLAAAASEIVGFLAAADIPTSVKSRPCQPGVEADIVDDTVATGFDGSRALILLALFGAVAAAGGLVVFVSRSPNHAVRSPAFLRRRRSKPAPERSAANFETPAAPSRGWQIKFAGEHGPVGARFDLTSISSGGVIGRDASVWFPIDESGVSRKHALLRSAGERLTIQDLGSTNGTWVNGVRLEPRQPAAIGAGDEITLGRIIGRLDRD